MNFDDHPVNKLFDEGAPEFVTMDPGILLQQAVASFEAETGRTLSPSQVEMYLCETDAYLLSVRAAEEQLAFERSYVAYAQGADLDVLGADRETPRIQAQSASATLEFTYEAGGGRVVPVGTRVSDGQTVFATTELGVLIAGETTVRVAAEALLPGPQANGIAAGTITTFVDQPFEAQSVTNPEVTSGGADRESDRRYRARIALAFERISRGGSREGYRAVVADWDSRVLAVEVVRPSPGYIDLYPLAEQPLNSADKSELLAHLDGKIPQGDAVQIRDPQAHGFNVPLHIVARHPDAAVAGGNAVAVVLAKWRRTLGGYVAPAELIAAAKAVPDVVNADVGALALTPVPETAFRDGSLTVTSEVV